MATRPLFLFVANNLLIPGTAQSLAIAFLASTLALVVAAAGLERRFYPRLFSADRRISGLAFYPYVASLVLLTSFGAAVAFSIALYFAGSGELSVAVAAYFVSEKLADEVLRWRLFERDFIAWGHASMARGFLQTGGLAALPYVPGVPDEAVFLVLALTFGNLVVFMPQLPGSLWRRLSPRRSRTAVWLARRTAHSLCRGWVLWAIVLLGASVSYLDRIVALVVDKTKLPLFMLVVMCFSLIQMSIDYYYLSRHRRDFLERRISVSAAFSSPQFLVSLVSGLAMSGVACAFVLALARHGGEFPWGYVLVIVTIQASMALASIPREVLYWSNSLDRILRIEGAFWMVFGSAVLAGRAIGFPAAGVFMLAATCAVARLAAYLLVASRISPATRRTGVIAG